MTNKTNAESDSSLADMAESPSHAQSAMICEARVATKTKGVIQNPIG